MNEKIINIDILDESHNCFLDYAKEVLEDRACPSAEDGLLRVHRELIWTMKEVLKMDKNSQYKKSASIVGTTLATSYFHGDSSCYGAMCKLSLPFLMRYPLVDGKGSLGTQESNDMQAASRYTNARPSIYSDLMMIDYKKNAVEVKPTYNNEYMEPVVLPALFPNAICNGRQAIGVSMAHNSMPHNLTEVCNALISYIDNNGKMTVEDIMKYIKGPDFPLGGTIINAKDIKKAYETGKSTTSLKIRADYEIKDRNIIFTSIPYRTVRSSIREQINKNIDEISEYIEDFNDESNTGNNRLVFTILKSVNIEDAIEILFKNTDLQTTCSFNMNYIINGSPKLCSMLDLLKAYIEHQNDVLIRTNSFDKEKNEKRLHILNGLLIALSSIDEVIETIKKSLDKNDARSKLINKFSIDEIQANAILDMKLSRLTKLDEMDLKKEIDEKIKSIEEETRIIEEEAYRNSVLKNMIIDMRDKYGDERRTKIADIEVKKVVMKKENKDIIIAIDGINIKTVKTVNAKGRTYKTKSNSKIIAFCDDGMAYRCSAEEIKSTNTNIKNITKAKGNILAISVADSEDLVYHTTKNGMIKISKVSDFNSTRNGSVSAIKLSDDDKVVAIDVGNFISCYQETNNGIKGILDITDLKTQGKATKGVKGLKLKDDESIIKAYFSNEESNCKRNSRGQK